MLARTLPASNGAQQTCRVDIEEDGSARVMKSLPMLANSVAAMLPAVSAERIDNGNGRSSGRRVERVAAGKEWDNAGVSRGLTPAMPRSLAPLLLARLTVVVAIHLRVRAVIQEIDGLVT